jgi:transcriptional regulator with XRE-family HTH domain
MRTRKGKARKQKLEIRPLKASAVGGRIRFLREAQGLSQGDIERATGLLRCYTSRVEHGHTVPSLETLERFAAALGAPLYLLFCTGGEAALAHRGELLRAPVGPKGARGKGKAMWPLFAKLRGLMGRIAKEDQDLLIDLAKQLAARATVAKPPGKSRRRR